MNKTKLTAIATQITAFYSSKGFINFSDYPVTLYFLCLYHRRVIVEEISPEHLINEIYDGFNECENPSELFQLRECFPVIDNFSKEDLRFVLESIEIIDRSDFHRDFAGIFEYFFEFITGVGHYKNGGFILHRGMMDLILENAGIREFKKVYNPFASNATFPSFANSQYDYFGQEYNRDIWRIGKMRLYAHGKGDNIRFVKASSITEWPADEKFDLIFSRLPLVNKLYIPDEQGNAGIFEIEIIKKSLSSLTETGKAVLIVNVDFWNSPNPEIIEYKEKLIREGCIHIVMNFPFGTFRNVNVKVVALVLGIVPAINLEVIDLVDYLESKRDFKGRVDWKIPRENTYSFPLPEENIMYSIAEEPDLNYEFHLSKELPFPESSTYHLNKETSFIQSFLERLYPKKKGPQLIDYVDFVSGSLRDENTAEYVLDIRHLADELFERNIEPDRLPKYKPAQREYRLINGEGVFVSLSGHDLKPTYYPGGKSILIPKEIVFLRIKDSDKLSYKFLIYLLQSAQVNHQLKEIKSFVGDVDKESQLKLIRVSVPSRKEQEEIVDKLYDDIVKNLRKEIKELGRETEERRTEADAFLRHKIAGPVSNLELFSTSIQSIVVDKIKIEFPNVLDLRINDQQVLNLGELLKHLVQSSRKIKKEVVLQTEELRVYDYPLESVTIIPWLDSYFNKIKDRNSTIQFYDNFGSIPEESKGVSLQINKDLFQILLDNLIDNVLKHAFSWERLESRRIETEISINPEERTLKLFISNTGKPFPDNLEVDDYIRKGVSGQKAEGKGLGGYLVNTISNYFEADWVLHKSDDSIFHKNTDLVTTFEFNFSY